MTLRSYITIMSLASFLCWLSWIFVVFLVNPEKSDWIGFGLFYASLFLALVGTSALGGFIVRFILLKQELAWRLVKEAFRQSFLLALLVIICLHLLAQNLFTWLNLIFLIIGLTVLEFFMLSLKQPDRPEI